MIIKLNFNPDEDTIFHIDKFITKFLRKYFSCTSTDQAYDWINNYHSIFKFKNVHSDPDEQTYELDMLFHRDHPYTVAERIYFINNKELKQKYGSAVEWQWSKGGIDVPQEAIQDWKDWWAEIKSK